MTGNAKPVILRGIGVSPGVAFGTAVSMVQQGALGADPNTITPDHVEPELERLDRAMRKSRRQILALKRLRSRLPTDAAHELGDVLDTQIKMLDGSRLIRGAQQKIEQDHFDASGAVRTKAEEIAQDFRSLDDPYLAGRADDVLEVAGRLLRNLHDAPRNAFSDVPADSILLAENISPADTALMDPARINGFAAALGGAQGHTAILARSLGLPAVLGLSDGLAEIANGTPLILDGTEGIVIVNPGRDQTVRYREKMARQERERRALDTLIGQPARTRDDVAIRLEVNLEIPKEVDMATRVGADGVGLFRTEFMFMNRDTPPSEDEQFDTLAAVVKAMDGKPVTIRTMDVGGEKLSYALGDDLAASPNPALGLRAIRLSLKRPKLLEAQICAILRAGAFGPVRILLPMIATASEVRAVREVMARMVKRLRRRGMAFANPTPPVGVMIEVPGAALAADSLSQVADFFAIGTNDLTQYTLAIDRTDDQVAHLYNPLHPAVLRLMDFSVQAALRARIPVSVCGEIAGDPRFTALLIGLGIRELSMSATNLLRVKQRLGQVELTAATARARMVMESHDSGRIRMLLEDLNGLA